MFYPQDRAQTVHMLEPTMVRCARCSALIALQDATRCGRHETEPLCGFCWTHHRETRRAESVHARLFNTLECWAEVGVLDWR